MNQKIIRIRSSLKKVYKQYLTVLKPLNNLRPKEIEVMALFLYYNEIEKPNFKRDEDRWNKVFDYETKALIKDELGIKDYTLQNILSSLRKNKAIVSEGDVRNKIPDYYIPNIGMEETKFNLVFSFEINGY